MVLNYKIICFFDFISVSTLDDSTSITQIQTENDQTMSTTRAVALLVVIFLASVLILGYLYYSFPHLNEYVLKK